MLDNEGFHKYMLNITDNPSLRIKYLLHIRYNEFNKYISHILL